MSSAILLVDHGSKKEAANNMLFSVGRLLKEMRPDLIVHVAHMELATPTIEDGVNACIADGASSITVFPYMLSPGRHVTEDIPRIVNKVTENNKKVTVKVTGPLGVHKKILEVALERCGL